MARIFEVEVIDEPMVLSLEELCSRIAPDEDFVIQCVDHGIAEVAGDNAGQWRFSSTAVLRIQRAYRLHRDLDINFTGLGVVLDLIEEMAQLRQELSVVRKRLKQWES